MKKIRTSLLAAGIAFALGSAAHAQQGQDPGAATRDSAQRQTERAAPRTSDRPADIVRDDRDARDDRDSRNTARRSGDESGALDEIADEHRDLSTFVRALEVSGLADSITGDTRYTVFAPTNDAFEDLGRSTEQLLAPENRAQLVEMLRAHIVADDLDRETAGRLQEALALNGDTIALEESDGSLKAGDATVRDADVRHGNLRIYMIDEVLDRGESQVATSEEGLRPRG